MKRIARTLELSLAAHSPYVEQEKLEGRLRNIGEIANPVEKRLVQTIDGFVSKHPKASSTALSGLSRAIGGFSYLGNGSLSSVYKKDDEVIKVYRHTAIMSEAERKGFAAEHGAMCDSLQEYMGIMVAKQTLSVDLHPFGEYRVALARQPFVRGKGLDLFELNTLKLKKPELAALCQRQRSAESQLRDLVDVTFEIADASGLVPDLNGADNFRLVGPSETLRLIDAEPISRDEHLAVHDHILKQAEVLAEFLEAA